MKTAVFFLSLLGSFLCMQAQDTLPTLSWPLGKIKHSCDAKKDTLTLQFSNSQKVELSGNVVLHLQCFLNGEVFQSVKDTLEMNFKANTPYSYLPVPYIFDFSEYGKYTFSLKAYYKREGEQEYKPVLDPYKLTGDSGVLTKDYYVWRFEPAYGNYDMNFEADEIHQSWEMLNPENKEKTGSWDRSMEKLSYKREGYDSSYYCVFGRGRNSGNTDAWMKSQCFKLFKDSVYTVSFYANWYPDNPLDTTSDPLKSLFVSVALVDSLSIQKLTNNIVYKDTAIYQRAWGKYEFQVQPSKDSLYYFGFRLKTTNRDLVRLRFDNFSLRSRHSGDTGQIGPVDTTDPEDPDTTHIDPEDPDTLHLQTPEFAPQEIKIYPNPVQSEGSLQIYISQSSMAILCDLQGRRYYAKELKKGKNTIYLPSLKRGVYLLQTKFGNAKIVIQ